MIEIIERHMVGGNRIEHIAEVKYISVNGVDIKRATRQAMIEWLDGSEENQAIVRSTTDPRQFSYVGVVHRDNAPDYIRTYANGEWDDNLLALPEY